MNLGSRDRLELGSWDSEVNYLPGDLSTPEPGLELTSLDSWPGFSQVGWLVETDQSPGTWQVPPLGKVHVRRIYFLPLSGKYLSFVLYFRIWLSSYELLKKNLAIPRVFLRSVNHKYSLKHS